MKKQDSLPEQKIPLNTVIIKETIRPDGSRRIQQDFSNCPTMAEQHTAHLSDINYLIEKYKPDELAAYIAARAQHRTEIIGHDFSKEPNMQEAKNLIYASKQAYENLPEDITRHFKSHLEFLKFIDNPANEEKMLRMGLLTKVQIQDVKIQDEQSQQNQTQNQNLNQQTENKTPKKTD